ncbi:MAG: ATP-binding protein [Candidatus Thermoplasmatota archaeon]|nr:ATP-binding protein [Candidatus Thermoplasmatota archaeon]
MYVERDLEGYFERIKGLYNTIAIAGPRQSGKTTFLKNRMNSRNSYLLMDDIDIRSLFETDVKGFENRYLKGNDVTILDEVQVCKDAGINLKYLNDTGNRTWITSSSETLLGKEVLSFLVGRVSILRLYPFSVSEIMRARQYHSPNDVQILRSIREMVSFGGYPRVVLEEDPLLKEVLLRDLHETLVLRDVARVFNIRDLGALERSALYLANMYTGQLSMDKMSRNVAISYKTLKEYLSAMEKSYLIRLVTPFFTNPNKELTKLPKVYFIDNGMRNIISGNVGMQLDGPSFENLIFTELIKLGHKPKYWQKKTGTEVDFVVRVGNETMPIEVKLNSVELKIESGMRSFIEQYSPKRAYIVNSAGKRGEIEVNDTKVSFIDIMKLKTVFKYMGWNTPDEKDEGSSFQEEYDIR